VIRNRSIFSVIAFVLLASLPGAALAQDEQPLSPEGQDWSLVASYDETSGEITSVPIGVQPTLLLQDGAASGFAGCNQFSGSYLLDGSSLTFGEEMSVTLALCEGPGQLVENSYLAALGQVGSWAIDGEQLQLYDNLGDLILTFEVPSVLWTRSQVTTLLTTLESLRTELETLRADTDALNVPTLRERIKALEAENKKMGNRLDKLESTPSVEPTAKPDSTLAFNAPEKVLLRGIPTRIANRCSPLRSALPKGTQGAVTCRPNSNVVSSVDYYLLEGSRAAAEFGSVMQTYNVPEASADGSTCMDGTKSQRYTIGNGWQSEGCYRENKTAQLRFVDNATDCTKLKVGAKTLASPAFYIALQGTNNDVARVYDWATRGLDPDAGQLTSIAQHIPSNGAPSPSCPT
jgi:heat shock protein HslJ